MDLMGIDLGTNSVGSSWVDTTKRDISVGVSVFPAGVDETDEFRGAPKNQDRRGKRSLRRILARRSQRKRRARQSLMEAKLLPSDSVVLRGLFESNPWKLRRKGVREALTAFEFGRVLLHLGQRRGAIGFDPDAGDEGKVKQAMTRLQLAMLNKYASEGGQLAANRCCERIEVLGKKKNRKDDESAELNYAYDELKKLCDDLLQQTDVTFGRFMADLMDERRHILCDGDGNEKKSKTGRVSHYYDPIRNRHRGDGPEFHAHRSMIRDEFLRLWNRQSEPDGALSELTSDERERLKRELDDPKLELYRDITKKAWRHGGALFGQRQTYWRTGTLGRCNLEPTDRCVPIADRHASYYRVLETVNNIRIKGPGDRIERPLKANERRKVIERLRTHKTGSVAAVRTALDIDKRSLKKRDIPERAYSLNIERDEDREINTDWFQRAIVLESIGIEKWNQWPDTKREKLNRAILKYDPAIDDDAIKLRGVANELGLSADECERLIAAWRTRPKLEKRLKLSRCAIQNLLPYMEKQLPDGRWPTQIEARQLFANDESNDATGQQRTRYRIGAHARKKAERHYTKKHPEELPPAPMLSNPVVRKAVHELRRHLIEHMRAHGGRKPDRIVIEFAREAKKPKKLSDWILALNRKREKIRKSIIEEVVKPAFGNRFRALSHNQLERAVDRVILARQQKELCAYSGTKYGSIAPEVAARGDGLEIDHVIPHGRCPNHNAWSNRVLCWRQSNQTKRMRTPREWWGPQFDDNIRPMAFMDGYEPDKDNPNEYFTKADYAAKWKNFNREDVPDQWRGSQLTDTAYAAREVQAYLQNALWPNEPSHLEGGQRRIFVTKGAYTNQLRKDWQLFQKLVDPSQDAFEAVEEASAKNRGDHREHAVDAVAIALTALPGRVEKNEVGRPTTIIDDLAHHQQKLQNQWFQAKEKGSDPRGLKREPLPPPWGTVKEFRQQVLSRIYNDFDELGDNGRANGRASSANPIVVSHRPIGRRIIGALHKDTLLGSLPDRPGRFVGRTWIYKDNGNYLKPGHLRLPEPEKKPDSIKRLTQEFLDAGMEATKATARKHAETVVNSLDFRPLLIDPPPGIGGLVRDLALRKRLRECIAAYEYIEKDKDGNIKLRKRLDPDKFSSKEIKQAFEAGAICHKSGVPIKHARLLRSMADPVIAFRKKWDYERKSWTRDTGNDGELDLQKRSRADRAYDSQNNHHIEIRENSKGKWSGQIVRTFDAARRVRVDKRDAVDRSDDAKKGKFVMSLARGETIRMKSPRMTVTFPNEIDFFIVVKLEKTATGSTTIVLAHHADARPQSGKDPLTGEKVSRNPKTRLRASKNEGANGVHPAFKELIAISPADLRSLTIENGRPPQKVRIDRLGNVFTLERD